MKAGQLNEKITILASKIITSDYGENKTEWNAKCSTRANVKFNSVNRTNENNEIFYSNDVEFKVRQYVNVNGFDRILYKNEQYRILSIIPNRELQEIKIITELVNE